MTMTTGRKALEEGLERGGNKTESLSLQYMNLVPMVGELSVAVAVAVHGD